MGALIAQVRLPTGAPVAHPGLALAAALAAAVCVALFVRAWLAANPPAARAAIRRGEHRGRWTRPMVLYLLAAVALYGAVLAL